MRALSWALAAALAVGACTGDPVGESPADSGTGGATDAGADSTPDAPTDAGGASAQVLAAGRDCPSDLRVSGGSVLWVDQGSLQNSGKDGVVATMPAVGCSDDSGVCIVTLASQQHSPAAVEIDPPTGDVYWATVGDDSVWRLPSQGKTPEAVATAQIFPRSLAIDDTSLFWVNAGAAGSSDGELRRRYLDGGTAGGIAVVAGLESPVDVVVLGTKFYLTIGGISDTTGAVSSADITGAGYAVLAKDQSRPRGITASAVHLYWANSSDGTIRRAQLDGSEQVTLVSGRPTPSDVAVDAKGIYWVEAGTPSQFTDGAVMAADLEGKKITALAQAQRDPRKVALDATHVYWLNRGTQGVQACTQHDGSVMRIAKPW